MAEQHEKALVPQIRFTGFTDPWEQRKLGELASKRIEKNTNRIKETFTNSAEHGVVSQLDYFDHDITNDANIGNYSVVYPDDFIYNPRISAVAPCGPINRNKLGRNGVMSPLYTVFSVDDTIDKLYLEHYFKTSRWHQFMFLEGNSGARSDRFSISDSIFFEMPIQCPVLEEQELIASFFDHLDSLITLHQRKYDKLCVLKKSMLDKMFPKGGSLYPEIRFAGFTDPWEQRKLGEELGFLRNNTLSRAELSDSEGTVFDIHYGDVLIKYGSVLDAEKADVPRIANDAVANRQTCDCLQDGDVIIADTAEDSAVGKCTELCNSAGKKVFSGLHTMPLRPMRKYASGYLGHYLNSPAFHDQLLPLMQGIKVISVSRSAIEDMTMSVPSVAEQASIGAFFDRLDSLITLHQRKYCGVVSWMLGVALVRLSSEK